MLTQPLSTRILRQATPPLAYLVTLRTAAGARAPLVLDEAQRTHIAAVVERLCNERHWQLHALAVRGTQLQAVVSADLAPERIFHAIQAGSQRALREAGSVSPTREVWARHGSTRYVWTQQRLGEIAAWVRELPVAEPVVPSALSRPPLRRLAL